MRFEVFQSTANTSPKRKRADISEGFPIPRLRVGLVLMQRITRSRVGLVLMQRIPRLRVGLVLMQRIPRLRVGLVLMQPTRGACASN